MVVNVEQLIWPGIEFTDVWSKKGGPGLCLRVHVAIIQIREEQLEQSKVRGETDDQDSTGYWENSITAMQRKKACGFGESWSQDLTKKNETFFLNKCL